MLEEKVGLEDAIKLLHSINFLCNIESNQIYSIDLILLNKKTKLEKSDIKRVNVDTMIGDKMANSYISLEGAANTLYFASNKLVKVNQKNNNSNAQLLQFAKYPLAENKAINQLTIKREKKPINNKLRGDVSSESRNKHRSNSRFTKASAAFCKANSNTLLNSAIDGEIKTKMLNESGYNEHSCEIVNIYRKSNNGILNRKRQQLY